MPPRHRQDATALHGAFVAGDLRPSDHLDRCLRVIAEKNPSINAVVAVCEDRARRQAAESDVRFERGEPLGPLDGLTVGIKDTFDVAGVPTTHGSPLFEDNVPAQDCLSVRRLAEAGAIIIGKTNVPEFAAGAHTTNRLFGPTRNPWDPSRSPGGSTGGGAAGVAAGMFDLALGSDLGGSLRVPAAFCGVVGLRPTPGLVPKWPDSVPFDHMSVDGLIAGSAIDLAHGLDVLAVPFAGDPKSPPGDWQPRFADGCLSTSGPAQKVAMLEDFCGIEIDAEIRQICDAAVTKVFPNRAQPKMDLSAGRAAYLPLRAKHVLDANANLLDQLDGLGTNIRSNIQEGLEESLLDMTKAEGVRTEMWSEVNALFGEFDLLVTPCTTIPPFDIEENIPSIIGGVPMKHYIDWIAPTFLFSMMCLPSISVPVGIDGRGLPVGLQVVSRRFEESLLLRVARDFAENLN